MSGVEEGGENGPRKGLTFRPEKALEHTIEQSVGDQPGKDKELCHSQRRFVKEKSCQTNLISSVRECNKPTGWGGSRRCLRPGDPGKGGGAALRADGKPKVGTTVQSRL